MVDIRTWSFQSGKYTFKPFHLPVSFLGEFYMCSASPLQFLSRWQLASLFVICALMIANFCFSGVSWGEEQKMVDEAGLTVFSSETVPSPLKTDTSKTNSGLESLSGRSSSVYSNVLPQHKEYLRASLELMAFLGISAGYYYGTLGDPKWYEFKSAGESLEARFITGDAYLLDNNAWDTNVGHIAAGTGYYLLSRGNDLSLIESMLLTLGASTTWEMFGELQDEFSINDAIMTPFGGFAIGEVMYQFGEFFQHSSHSIPNQVLGILFGPSTAIHRWLDNDRPAPPAHVDKFGFTTDAWHRFRLYAGGGASYSGDTHKYSAESEMGFDFQVVTAEKYGKPGEASTFYKDGVFNEMALDAVLSGSDVVDFRFFSKTAFLGYYQQNILKEDASQNLEGNSLFVGLGSALEYYSHLFSEMREEDKQTVCDLIGPSLVADFYHQGLHLRVGADIYPTFSMVQPAAREFYNQNRNLAGVKSVYRAEDYYYALGMGTVGRMEMEYGPFGLEGHIRYHYFNSIEGLDRYQSIVVNDIPLEDERLWLQLTFLYDLPIENLKLGLN